jgi:hypothetical protein
MTTMPLLNVPKPPRSLAEVSEVARRSLRGRPTSPGAVRRRLVRCLLIAVVLAAPCPTPICEPRSNLEVVILEIPARTVHGPGKTWLHLPARWGLDPDPDRGLAEDQNPCRSDRDPDPAVSG